jgi:SET domain-containing protein
MALLEKSLVIKRSKIPGAGKGLFTKQFIAKGTRIVEYKGRATTWKMVEQQKDFNGCVYYIKRDLVIDAKNYKKTFGRYANDANGISKLKRMTNNSRYIIDGKRVFIEATKDIDAGSEIFVSYGKEYWDVVRYNKRLGY